MPRIPEISIKNSTELVVTQIPVNKKENMNALLSLKISRINKTLISAQSQMICPVLFGELTGSKELIGLLKTYFHICCELSRSSQDSLTQKVGLSFA